jgi:hypothetical protein
MAWLRQTMPPNQFPINFQKTISNIQKQKQSALHYWKLGIEHWKFRLPPTIMWPHADRPARDSQKGHLKRKRGVG